MSKSRKEFLQELLDLENKNLEDVEEMPNSILKTNEIIDTTNDKENNDDEKITKPKKQRTQKQLEAFENAKKIRDANTLKRKEEQSKKEQEERKILEEKLVRKAISIKKKEIKKQAVLDQISDDDTPIEKIKEIAKQIPIPKIAVAQKINFF